MSRVAAELSERSLPTRTGATEARRILAEEVQRSEGEALSARD